MDRGHRQETDKLRGIRDVDRREAGAVASGAEGQSFGRHQLRRPFLRDVSQAPHPLSGDTEGNDTSAAASNQ